MSDAILSYSLGDPITGLRLYMKGLTRMDFKLIYDIGMNNGDDTAYYLHRGFKVLAVEANPVLAEQAARRFAKEIASGRLTILNVGVGEAEGHFPFWVCESRSEWSSFDRNLASRGGEPHHRIDVPCRKLSDILEEHGIPYYLKVDIEGYDRICVNELCPKSLPRYLSVESDGPELVNRMSELGYNRFKCISQYAFISVEWPPSREQRRYELVARLSWSQKVPIRTFRRLGGKRWVDKQLGVFRSRPDWVFPPGSSGPISDDLPGKWQTADELTETYSRLKDRMRSGAHSIFWGATEDSFWSDFHATRVD